MAEVKERLKHGKALCGKVFKKFVETFNWLVDFDENLCGDGDNGNQGKIVLDRKDERHPVIRCKGCGIIKDEDENEPSLPWTFSCAIDPDTQERTGGWTNCRMQVGLDCRWRSPDIDGQQPGSYPEGYPDIIQDTDTCDDGDHYVEVDLNEDTAKIVVDTEDDHLEPTDPEHNVVRVFIGTVVNGELQNGMHMNPVIYKYI